jgi:ATP:ADP antiporter, AAA family
MANVHSSARHSRHPPALRQGCARPQSARRMKRVFGQKENARRKKRDGWLMSVVSESFASRGAQTAFFAAIDLTVNVITLVVQIFFTGRLVRWLGVGVVLGLLPALSMLGFGAIAVVPTLAAVASFQVLRRAGNYALSQPARQVLYTVVSREDRYKAKNFIDTAVYRAGDQVGAWSYALVGFIGWGIKEAGIIAIVLSALWLANSLWLGKRQEVLAEEQAHAERNNAEAAATA